MEIAQVLNTLSLTEMPPLDVLEEIIEEEVFHLRDYFLRNPVVKPLYTARIRKLRTLQSIIEHFSLEQSAAPNIIRIEPEVNATEILVLLQDFEEKQSKVKVQLASSLNIIYVASLAEELIIQQQKFEQGFKEIFDQNYQRKLRDERVKLADQIPTGEVIRDLIAGEREAALSAIQKEYERILLIT